MKYKKKYRFIWQTNRNNAITSRKITNVEDYSEVASSQIRCYIWITIFQIFYSSNARACGEVADRRDGNILSLPVERSRYSFNHGCLVVMLSISHILFYRCPDAQSGFLPPVKELSRLHGICEFKHAPPCHDSNRISPRLSRSCDFFFSLSGGEKLCEEALSLVRLVGIWTREL